MSKDLTRYLQERILVLDGAMGTNLADRGFTGTPELACIDAPELVLAVHKEFIEAGSDAIITNTFGGNPLKLKKLGLADRFEQLNTAAVEIARQAAGDRVFVFGDIGPTGELVEPVGDAGFDEVYQAFARQAAVLARSGVDALILETFTDIQEARIALLAALENTELPVFVTLTFNQDGRTDVSATSPQAAAGILEPLGAFGTGSNCGAGPEQFVALVKDFSEVAERPLVFQPNAGIPRVEQGNTVFDASPDDYRHFAEFAVEAGARLIGGCCGSKPAHIAAVAGVVKGKKPARMRKRNYFYLCTPRDFFRWDDFVIIGERINPSGRKDLQEDIRTRSFSLVEQEAREQEKAGAGIIDVNVSIALEKESALLPDAVRRVSLAAGIPLSIDTTDAGAAEAALKLYPGRALLNSVNLKQDSIDSMLTLAKRFGQAFIALALDDRGVAKSFERKREILEKLLEVAEEHGFSRFDILFDLVVLSAATYPVDDTVKAIRYLSEKGLLTTVGLSNVSHGLPRRRDYNRAFAALAAAAGLYSAIIDPLDRELIDTIKASRFLVRQTTGLLPAAETEVAVEKQEKPDTDEERLYHSILNGRREDAAEAARRLSEKLEPYRIVSEIMAPAMQEVGDRFNKKQIFLPHVLMSAEAMKAAFAVLRPLFKNQPASFRGRVVLATVEGDVHDIGKNIVGTILEANGYEVHDLGVDVKPETVLEKAQALKADIVGLSCLMTTTLEAMRRTVGLLKSQLNSVIVAIGGAVVTDRVRQEFGADLYARDAMEFISVLERTRK